MTRLPASSDRTAATPTFKDGFGTRVRVTDAGGDPVEHLQLVPELANQESSIRDRVGRLINFRHARYVRLRSVDRAKTGLKPLIIAYDALDGHRLSTVLESLAAIPLTVECDVALQIVRDLLPAIGILHDSRKVTHGAIAPERLVYTSQQRLVIVDHGLGAALMRMNLPRKKLWEQFRIASPATNRAVFDEKMDVVQIGLVALALLLGRPLADDEYPAQVKRLIFSIKETSSRIGSRPIGPELRRWLERATGVDEAQTFNSIKEAQDAFEGVVAVDRYVPSAAAVKGFFLRYDELIARAKPADDVAEKGASSKSTVDVDSALSELQMQVTIAPRRRAAADPPPAAAEAVEIKPPARARTTKTETKADAKAKTDAKAEPDAKAQPAAAEAAPSGRRKSDQIDALQALQEEMSAASGDISALEQTANAVYDDAATHVVAKPVDDSERLAREAAERARQDAETRERAEREGRALAEQVARDAAEQVAREAADRAAAERQARAASEREAVERGARQEAERQAHEASLRATREASEREAAERAARDAAAREGAEREARQRLERDAADGAERRAREQAERDAAEQAAQARRDQEARERDVRSAAEREAAEKAQREGAAREAAERQAREQAERESRAHAERAEKEAAERAAAERAAREAAQRAERAEREAAERAERAQREAEGREAAERQARELAEREARAAERALKEAAERAAAERAAHQAAELAAREAAERATAERAAREAAQRAEREAADRQAAERAAHEAKERADREATERAAAERAAREAAEREAAHKIARELAEQAVVEATEREAEHRIALQAAEQAVREAAERADTERAARQVAEQAAREASERALASLAAQHADARGEFEAAGRVAAERAAREHAEAAEQERIARTQAQREAREAGERAQREAAERAAAERAAREHAARAETEREARAAAERAAREAATLMEAERQARAAAEQAARDAAAREAAERAAREAAELAADSEPRRRRKKKRPAGRTPEEAIAVQPLPSSTETSAPAPATFTSVPEAPAAPIVQWQPGQSVEVMPAWARGAADAGASTAAGEPEPAACTPSGPASTEAYAPAEPSASILPFKPQPDTWMHRAPQQAEAAADGESRAVPPGTTVAPRRSFRVNWARTLAASLLVALLEGVAFATAWWYVTPEQQGWLVVHTKPAGIQIAVDGLVLGKTPFAKALAPGRHTIELRYGTGTRVVPVEISAGVQTEQRLSWGNGFTSGQASISSTPAGSKVSIDGRLMGKTPLTVSDLLPGKHEVTVEGEKGTVSTMLMVEAGQTTELDVPVYAGWASVLSPVQLDILLEGKLVGSTEIEKLMLRPGTHNLELVNESLGYRGAVEVRVRPGATTSVSVVPKTAVTVEAPEGTELSINGENMGTLPNAALQVPLGTAEFVMRYKDEERRQVVPVTMSAPVTVKYELASVVERDPAR